MPISKMVVTINSITDSNFSRFEKDLNTTTPDVSTFEIVVDQILNVSIVIALAITMVSVGCTMEISKIKNHLIKPKGVAIAVVAQYGIMPLTAFALARLLQLSPVEYISVLICGCCPGGNLSNLFTLAFQGDMNLSFVMTTFSTVLALGLMPLLLYLYCWGIRNLVIPYTNIILSLIMILVPCGIGILINHRVPQYAKIVTKVGLVIILVAAVAISILTGLIHGAAVLTVLSPHLIAIASLMPLIGYICGYILSALFKLNASCRRTISLETGCQNIQLCIAILKLSFSTEVIGNLYFFPVIYIVFQIFEALILLILFRCQQRWINAKETNMYTLQGAAEEKMEEPTNTDTEGAT